MPGRCARGRLRHPRARRFCARRCCMYDRSSGTIRTVQRGARSESPAGRGATDGCRYHGRGAPSSRSRCLDRRVPAPDFCGTLGHGRDGPCSVSRTISRKICSALHTRSASCRRPVSPTLIRPDSREADTFNSRAARDRRRSRLGSVRDSSGRGLNRWDRVDVTGAGWRHPPHRLWSVCGQSEWCCLDDGHRRRHHSPCHCQEHLRSFSDGEESYSCRSTGVAHVSGQNPWIGGCLSPFP